MTQFYDAFISYGRRHSKDFAIKLHARLVERGYRVWFDQQDIPPSVDYQRQIDDGIERAHNFLFIISPHSVESVYCAKEVDLALGCGKRIIPLLHVRADRDLMNPELRKRNWIYFQEEDDFEKAFEDLVGVFETQTDYVHQHTHLLTQALRWDRHSRQSQYLLAGAEREQAKAWLHHRFQNALPPCTPSDLHCEHITKSLQDARNRMAQVFLSYASEDKEVMAKIRRSLQREGITVWTNTTDVQTGQNFQQAIRRGIEEADNLVYLLSPNSLQSEYCQQELDYALSLHKRVIPIRVQQMGAATLPDPLRNLHFIDLTDNETERDYLLDEHQLMNVLREEDTYHERHKLFLVSALQWERQQRQSNFLLWGYSLRLADNWLKAAQRRAKYPPTPLQVAFIQASLQQPPVSTLDAFLFYPRSQVDFADKLNKKLQAWGKRIWFDRESIASEVDLQQEIHKGIEQSENFICILSEDWLADCLEECPSEVAYAHQLNKRFILVWHQELDLKRLPLTLATARRVDFCHWDRDADTCVGELIEAMEVDRDHVLLHTQFLQRSREWQQKDRSLDLLLRGRELTAAEQWLTASVAKKPEATLLQAEYIQAGRQQQQRSQRRVLAGVSAALAVSIALSIVALVQSYRASISEIEAIALSSQALLQSGDTLNSLIEGIKARQYQRKLPLQRFAIDDELRLQVKETLHQAIYNVQEYNRFQVDTTTDKVAFSPDGELIATVADRIIYLWQRDGTLLKKLEAHKDGSTFAFSPDSQILAFTSGENVKLWQRDGTLVKTLEGHSKWVSDIAFSPDSQLLASASDDSTLKLWRRDGTLVKTLDYSAWVNSVVFSPDGQLLASAHGDVGIELWRRDGTLVKTLEGHSGWVNSVVFSPDGQLLASVSGDNTVKLWRRDGTLVKSLEGHTESVSDSVSDVVFSPDSQLFASVSADGAVKLWQRDGTLVKTLEGDRDWVNSVVFSPDSQLFAVDAGSTAELWQSDGTLLATLDEHEDSVRSMAFSPDLKTLATADERGTIHLWRNDGRLLATLQGHSQGVGSLVFSPDGGTIASTGWWDGTLRLWRINPLVGYFREREAKDVASDPAKNKNAKSNPIQTVYTWVGSDPNGGFLTFNSYDSDDDVTFDKTLNLWNPDGSDIELITDPDGIRSVAVSSDGQTIASVSESNSIKLWRRDGTLIRSIAGSDDFYVYLVAFSPDGRELAGGGYDTTTGYGIIKLWQLDGTEIDTFKQRDGIGTIAYNPKHQTLVSDSAGGSISLWNRNGDFTRVIQAHRFWVGAIAISPDSEVIISGGGDKKVKLWQQDATSPRTLGEHDRVTAVAVSPDSQLFASASADKTVKLWRRDGTLVTTFKGQREMFSVAFSADGKYLAAGGIGDTAVRWDLHPVLNADKGDDVVFACDWVRDYLRRHPNPKTSNLCNDVAAPVSEPSNRSNQE